MDSFQIHDVKAMEKFIDKDPGIVLRNTFSDRDYTYSQCNLLAIAIKYKAFETCKLLIDRGSDVNSKNVQIQYEKIHNQTPLMMVVSLCRSDTGEQLYELLISLINHGANVNFTDCGYSILCIAALCPDVRIVKAVYYAGANIMYRITSPNRWIDGCSALMLLTFLRHDVLDAETVVTFLLSAGAESFDYEQDYEQHTHFTQFKLKVPILELWNKGKHPLQIERSCTIDMLRNNTKLPIDILDLVGQFFIVNARS